MTTARRDRLYFFIAVLKTGLVNQANGSAYIEMGNTKAVCAV